MTLTFIRMDLTAVKSEPDPIKKVDMLTEVVGKLIRELEDRDRQLRGLTGYTGSAIR